MSTILRTKVMDELGASDYTKRIKVAKRTSFDRECHTRIRYERHLTRGNTRTLSRISKFTQPTKGYQANDKLREYEVATPPPMEGRLHVPTQTGVYLEELREPVKERDAECQADAFLDRPSTPIFVPAKIGIDVETQIEEGDLFDFDVEVVPVLDAFVAYTLEQSLLEVIQEEELLELREQQRRFEEIRLCELAEKQRLAEQDRRYYEERERRVAKQEEIIEIEEETAYKINARAFARNYIIDLIPSLCLKLEEQGFFFDDVQQDIEEIFWPWLMDKVDDEINSLSKCSQLLDSLVKDAIDVKLQQDIKLEQDEGTEELPTPENITPEKIDEVSQEEKSEGKVEAEELGSELE